jgi:hypothetical protein
MRDGWLTVATYLTETEAEVARTYLDALDIPTAIQKDNCGGLRPHLDLHHGVKVQVPADQADAARDALKASDGPPAPSWVCAGCGELSEGGFDACWNCGRERE